VTERASSAEIEAFLFDIDGTLISTGGASDRAWRRAFEELQGVTVDVGQYTGTGVTDPQVGLTSFRGALGREPSRQEMACLMAARLRYLPEEVSSSETYRVMPGAERLLRRLAEEGRLLGLLTGNVEAAAHIKLARAGLNRYFSFGAYGSDAVERSAVARRALERAQLVFGGSLERDLCMCIGDTPRDIEAAHGAGIRITGVATGEYGFEKLRQAGADFTVESLEDRLPF
jgi:phosphoglycolate phosphatase-like HAD superfamily hydrolase